MKPDLLPPDIKGRWEDIQKLPLIYLFYDDISFDNIYCWFNCQIFDPALIPLDKFDKFVLSFHTEFLEHKILFDFFSCNPDKEFLLISDWNHHENIFPSNVTTVTWITLHTQADYIIRTHGYCKSKNPSRRLSSLSYRHEFHKAAITSYILSHTQPSDRILSWWDVKRQPPYYLQPGYHIDPAIAKYVLHPVFQNLDPIRLDEFDNSPLANTQWRHLAYLDCVFNLTNESVYNSNSEIGRLPGPYITDKTWKVLLSGTGLIPVGQTGTIEHLKSLGMFFDYQIDLSFDSLVHDDERILGIFSTIDSILERPIYRLQKDIQESNAYNINHIVTKRFSKKCQDHNSQQRDKIVRWIKK
jgi:hypothetical protein